MIRPLAASAIALLIAFAFPDGADDNRKPVPAKTDVDVAAQKIKEVFRSEFAKTKASDRAALARRLSELAAETKDDVATRYAILMEAKELASKSGDAILFLATARQIAADFRISLRDACGKDAPASSMTGLAVPREQVQALLELVDEAIDAGDFTAAGASVVGIESIARKNRFPDLVAAAQLRSQSLPALRKDFVNLGASRKTLETSPADVEANRCVGRFLCFVRRNWEEGLARLVLGDDPKLRDAVNKKDVQAAAGDAKVQFAAADAWQTSWRLSLDPPSEGVHRKPLSLLAEPCRPEARRPGQGARGRPDQGTVEIGRSCIQCPRPSPRPSLRRRPSDFRPAASGAMREKLLAEGGGTGDSEAAVARGLQWLARVQSADGRWKCDGNFPDKGNPNDAAGTALGLLPFLGRRPASHRPPRTIFTTARSTRRSSISSRFRTRRLAPSTGTCTRTPSAPLRCANRSASAGITLSSGRLRAPSITS